MINWDALQIALANFHFMRPWWLLMLPVLVAAVVYLKQGAKGNAKWQQAIAPHLMAAMLVPKRFLSWFNPPNLGALLLSLSCIILAGPTWQQQPSPLVQDEAIAVVVLDLSYTMEQKDVQPSRLQRAKHKISDLLKLRAGARTALVVYAGSAHTVIPLTNDGNVINNFLSALATEIMPADGKNAAKALPIVEHILAESPVPGTVVLITDDMSVADMASYTGFFAQRNDQLLILGIGTESVVEEQPNDAFYPLNTAALKQLASNAGGYYQQLTIDSTDVERLYRRIENYLATVTDNTRPWLDAGYFLLFPVALVFLLWFRRGWTIHWCLLLVLGVGMGATPNAQAQEFRFANLWLTSDQQGYYYFKAGDYDTAAQRFTDPAWRGLAYYYDENFSAAADVWSAIDSDEGLFNLATALAQGQNYVYAVQVYDRLLKRNPDFPGAQKNRDFLQEIIDDINRMSESQSSEQGEGSKELGDEPLRAEGAERQDTYVAQEEPLTAEQLLADEKIQQMWLRQVQKDPSAFLAVKFAMQLSDEASGKEASVKETSGAEVERTAEDAIDE